MKHLQRSVAPALGLSTLLAMLLLPMLNSNAVAQLPGSWQKIKVADHWRPIDMDFADSAYGLILADSGFGKAEIFRTTDGGADWSDLGPMPKGYAYDRTYYHGFTVPNHTEAYLLGTSYPFVSKDGGHTWTAGLYPTTFSSVIGGRMFGGGFGYVVARNDQLPATLNFYATYDYARNFSQQRSSFRTESDQQDVVFVDSLHSWISDLGIKQDGSYDSYELISRSATGGSAWTHTAIDTNRTATLHEMVGSPDPDYAYTLGGKDNSSEDFIQTSDGGKSWTADSSIRGGRVVKLASPIAGQLWAFVAHAPFRGSNYDLSMPYPLHEAYSDSLLYSADNGRTWQRDGTTFNKDTMVEMRWPDARHGFIASWRDSALYLYHYIAPPLVVAAASALAAPQVTLLESPATSLLRFRTTLRGAAQLRIVDLLGRTRLAAERVLTPSSAIELQLGTLPTGVYFLLLKQGSHTISTRFLKE